MKIQHKDDIYDIYSPKELLKIFTSVNKNSKTRRAYIFMSLYSHPLACHLEKLVYWFTPNEKGQFKGKFKNKKGTFAVVEVREKWGRYIGVTPTQCRRAINEGSKRGWVETSVEGWEYSPTKATFMVLTCRFIEVLRRVVRYLDKQKDEGSIENDPKIVKGILEKIEKEIGKD